MTASLPLERVLSEAEKLVRLKLGDDFATAVCGMSDALAAVGRVQAMRAAGGAAADTYLMHARAELDRAMDSLGRAQRALEGERSRQAL